MTRLPVVLLTVLAAAAAPAAPANCEFLPKAPAPAWVSGNPALDGHHTGVGQAQARDLDPGQAMERAKQAALRDLAGNIEVQVRTELRVQETAAGTPDDLKSRLEVESSTETAAAAVLADVEVDGTWLDRRSCVVWMRVKVETPVIRAIQVRETQLSRFKLLKALVQTAEDGSASLDERERALEQAAALVSRIDYAYSPDGTGEKYFSAIIERLRPVLARARGRFEINAKEFAEAEERLQRARRENGIAAQARMAAQAKTLLTGVSSRAPYGTAPDFWPEKATWALAEFERDTGNPCEARRLFSELARRATDMKWRERAESAARGPVCTPDLRESGALRRLVYGRDVLLLCAYKLGKSAQVWDRACADTQALLTSHGALTVRTPEAPASQQMQWAEKCRTGCREPALTGGLSIVMVTQGAMATRNNKENPFGRDYQFKGQVTTYVLNAGAAEFNDSYNGIGGWNPVSSDMAMDVLAIQAGMRFREKAAAHYAAAD